MISNRHIRYDWPEWVDWDNQKSIKTMCGVRSRPGLCGIPGITQQDPVVLRKGQEAWGWCMPCVRITFPYYLPPSLTIKVTSPFIITLHAQARVALAKQYHSNLLRTVSKMDITRNPNTLAVLLMNIRDLEYEYTWLTASESS